MWVQWVGNGIFARENSVWTPPSKWALTWDWGLPWAIFEACSVHIRYNRTGMACHFHRYLWNVYWNVLMNITSLLCCSTPSSKSKSEWAIIYFKIIVDLTVFSKSCNWKSINILFHWLESNNTGLLLCPPSSALKWQEKLTQQKYKVSPNWEPLRKSIDCLPQQLQPWRHTATCMWFLGFLSRIWGCVIVSQILPLCWISVTEIPVTTSRTSEQPSRLMVELHTQGKEKKGSAWDKSTSPCFNSGLFLLVENAARSEGE